MPSKTVAGEHRPYRRAELGLLRATLDERWPLLADDEALHWLRRHDAGRSSYSRVRVHVIRAQLDAVIALALHLALRRAEIRALDVNAAHFDNAYVMVGDWDTDDHREVPFTSTARESLRRWCDTRAWLRPTTGALWVNTHAAPTAQLPMSAETFNRLLHTYVGPGWELRRLRDTCAAGWVRAGMPLEHLRQLLGLARIEDTLPYAKLVGGSLEGRMARLDGLFTDLVVVRDQAPVAR